MCVCGGVCVHGLNLSYFGYLFWGTLTHQKQEKLHTANTEAGMDDGDSQNLLLKKSVATP